MLISSIRSAETASTAHATASAFICPEVDTIFEIGGQYSKYVRLENGLVKDFTMNKACAAGTGSFLEEQAEKLGISIKRDFARLALAADSLARCSGAHLVVGGGDLHIQGVVRAQHPAGVHGDLIDALDLGRVLAGLDRQGQAAVAVVVGVIALHPVVAHGQRQGIGGIGDRHIRQQVGVALDAINIGIQLEILDLRVMETAEGQLAAAAVIDLGGNRRVHQRIDPLLLIRIAIAGSRQHTGGGFSIHSKRGLAVFIGHSPVNRCCRAGGRITQAN